MKTAVLAAMAALTLGAAPALANGQWTGFYGGIGIGQLDVDTTVGDNDDTSYGLHAGYRYDLGQWVVGGEVEYDFTDVDLAPGVSVDHVLRLKATFGYDLGQTLVYVAGGWAEVDVDGLGDEDGGFYGLGVAYQVTPRTILSAELLEHDFNNIAGSGIDADATSFAVRASLRF